MKVYKNGLVAEANKDQLELMLDSGWTKEKPEETTEKTTEEKTEPEKPTIKTVRKPQPIKT